MLRLTSLYPCVSLQKLEEQDRKALNVKEQLQREHRYLKRRLEQLSVSGSLERVRTDSMGSTISTDSEQGSARSRQFEKTKKRIMQPLGALPHSHILYRSMRTVSRLVLRNYDMQVKSTAQLWLRRRLTCPLDNVNPVRAVFLFVPSRAAVHVRKPALGCRAMP